MAFRWFGREAAPVEVEKKASATGKLVALASGSGRVVWSPRDTVSLTRTGFAGNPVGFRAVKLIAEAAAAVPLVCQDQSCRYDTHPLIGLIRRHALKRRRTVGRAGAGGQIGKQPHTPRQHQSGQRLAYRRLQQQQAEHIADEAREDEQEAGHRQPDALQ